jgi:hypothetical protein
MIVHTRAALIKHVRGAVKSFGGRLNQCAASCFHRQVVDHIPDELALALLPIVRLIAEMSVQVRDFRQAPRGTPSALGATTRWMQMTR